MKVDETQRLRELLEAAKASRRDAAPHELDQVYARLQEQLADDERATPAFGRWVLAGGMAALLLVVGAAALMVRRSPAEQAATAVAAKAPLPPVGPMQVSRVEGRYQLAGARADIAHFIEGASLTLGDGARAQLEVGDLASVTLVGPAELVKARLLEVRSGRASFGVTKRPPGEAFAVQAGDTLVVVHGTRFAVSVSDDLLKGIRVTEGLVELRGPRFGADGGAVLLPAGSQWGDAPEVESTAGLGATEATGYFEVSTEPEGAAVFIDGVERGRAPLLERVSVGSHRLEARLPDHQESQATTRVEAGQLAHALLTLVPDAAPLEPDPVEPAALARRTNLMQAAARALRLGRCKELEQLRVTAAKNSPHSADAIAALVAECWLRAGKLKLALEIYTGLAAKGGSGAEVAQFETSKLLAELERPADALRELDVYLSRYPRGRFVGEASFRRCEVLLVLARRADARSCLTSFNATNPSVNRKNDVTFTLATIERTDGQWAKAAALYAAYLEANPATRVDTALYQLARCRKMAGLPGVNEAIAEYERRFPEGAHLAELAKLKQ